MPPLLFHGGEGGGPGQSAGNWEDSGGRGRHEVKGLTGPDRDGRGGGTEEGCPGGFHISTTRRLLATPHPSPAQGGQPRERSLPHLSPRCPVLQRAAQREHLVLGDTECRIPLTGPLNADQIQNTPCTTQVNLIEVFTMEAIDF